MALLVLREGQLLTYIFKPQVRLQWFSEFHMKSFLFTSRFTVTTTNLIQNPHIRASFFTGYDSYIKKYEKQKEPIFKGKKSQNHKLYHCLNKGSQKNNPLLTYI